MTDDEFLEYLRTVNSTYADQIRIADQKAAYIFTFILAMLIWSSEIRSLFAWRRFLSEPVPVMLFGGILAGALLTALISAILTVMPRSRSGGTSLYWGAWPQRRDSVVAAGEAKDRGFLVDEQIRNIDNLSAICRSKYRFVGLAFRALMVAVVAYLAVLVAG